MAGEPIVSGGFVSSELPGSEEVSSETIPLPTIVVFGATGDLTHRKLIPALYNLAADGDLPAGLRVIGFARRDKSNEEFRSGLEELNQKIRSGELRNRGGDLVEKELTEALIREDQRVVYPVDDGIPVMLIDESIEL